MRLSTTSRALAMNTLAMALGLAYGSQAMAADSAAAPATAASGNASSATDSLKLETVVITAQKRRERLLDVPLAVTSLTGQALEDRKIEGPAALAGVVPNLSITQAPTSGLIANVGMRGIASGQPSIWADPAVGMYVDGVFVGKNMGSLTDVVDIERLEVLRGPQGTLFGRNTEAGAINFITKKPTGVFGGAVGVELGNFNRRVERVSMDLPKVGMLSAAFALRNEKQDGFISNPDGDAWGGKNRQAGRLALRLEPVSALTIDYALDRTHIKETPPAGMLISSTGYGSLYPVTTQIGGNTFAFQNPTCLAKNGAGVCVFPSPGLAPGMVQYVQTGYPSSLAATTTFGPEYQGVGLTGHTLITEYKVGPSDTIKYTAAWRKMHYFDALDYDGTPLPIFQGARDTQYFTRSHELQWVGSSGPLKYVGGLYLFDDSGRTLQNQAGNLLTFTPALIGYQNSNFGINTTARAVYGQLDYEVNSSLVATVGGRYTTEDKGVSVRRFRTDKNFNQGSNPFTLQGEAEASFSKFTPTFNLLYKLTPETNLFGRIAQGFKSGGFPAEAPMTATSSPLTPFKPETSTAYELGVKTSFLDGRGQLSANLFFTKVSDYQISLLPAGSISPTQVNAGKLQTQGLEVDAAFRVTSGLKLTGSYGYMDVKFKQYLAFSATGAPVDAASNTVPSGAPKHTLNLNVDARLAQFESGLRLRGMVDYRYVAKRYIYPGQISATAPNATVGNSAAESELGAISSVDLRLILTGIKLGGPGEADATLWVKNATNQHTLVSMLDVSGFYQGGYWSDPRTVGLTFNYRW